MKRSLPTFYPAANSTQSWSKRNSLMEDVKGLKITHSSELMENYLQAEIQSPTGHFEALQLENENGHALIFAIDSQGIFYGLQECSGETGTGWKRHDLSRSTLRKHFTPEDNATVRIFGVGQSHLDSSIDPLYQKHIDLTRRRML